MPTPYAPATATKSLLVHAGDLGVNLSYSVLPPQFAGLEACVSASALAPTPTFPTPPFTHRDAGVAMASGFDEVILDVLPVVDSAGNVSTAAAPAAYRSAALLGKPIWLLVRTAGYGQAGSAEEALALANSVLSLLWSDAINFFFSQTLAGFCFLSPDLNVQFSDGSTIDREFQNALVQSCRAIDKACMFLTMRPADATTLIGPVLAGSSTSGKALANPIIGCSRSSRDCLAVLYPNPQTRQFNPSVPAGQLAATLTPTNRDSGFTPNLDVAYVVAVPDGGWGTDGAFGTAPGTSGDDVKLSALFAYVAAMGVTVMGVQAGQFVPAPAQFMPLDSSVNTTGSFRTWSIGGNVSVAYAAADGGTTTVVFSGADLSVISTTTT